MSRASLRGVRRLGAVVAAVLTAAVLPLPAVAADPIVNVTAPAVSGEPVFGAVLSADPGTWTPDGLTFGYVWTRDGDAVAGETGDRYRLGLADLGHRISVLVTASDAEGSSVAATSAATPTVRRADLVNRGLPEITGVTRYTRTLSATRGAWSARPRSVSYRWLRDGAAIPDATRSSYTLQAADVGRRIRVAVTVRRPGFRPATATSAATRRIQHRVPVRRAVTYRVETRGTITASLATFRTLIQQTYDDPRGWRSAGISFRRVAKGGTFSVVLAEAGWVPRFSSGCSAQWSCRVGRYVIINQTRWQQASPSWTQRHLPLRDYRHMVLNHETGHWLGHGHASCPGKGRPAPVMQQQSKDLGGCRHNPWPLASELWTR